MEMLIVRYLLIRLGNISAKHVVIYKYMPIYVS